MATSGSTSFNPDFLEIAEEAYERIGVEMDVGYDLRTARRSLDLLLLDWANRGLNMWTIEQGSQALVSGTKTYTLAADTVDLVDHVLRVTDTSTRDYQLNRMAFPNYASRTNKDQSGRPTEIYIERLRTPQFTLWPVPDSNATYSVEYWRLRRIEEVGAYTNTIDAPFRFLPALVSGLAYYLAQKKPEAASRVIPLKMIYEEEFNRAADEDRDRATLRLVPRRYYV